MTHRRPHDWRVPPVILVPALVGLGLLLLPMAGLLWRAPWARFPDLLISESVVTALRLSVMTATAATALSLLGGVPLAWILARSRLPGLTVVRGLVTVPLVLPPVIGGVALLMAFGRRGVVGSWLDQLFGVSIPFTTVAVVLAQTFVAMPFLVVAVEGALRTADHRYDDIAATLGASPWLIFRRVTLPAVAPGILAGAVLCWARALGEFGATITFAGSFPGTTRTLPLEAYVAIGAGDIDTAVVLSVLMIGISVTILIALRGRWMRAT
ncbi:molybdate ABC transporter permease subunit [Actinobacteria bacterium YIM 96077]|uniref:Molybdenum transport system permease n=1 Tax=Phytoactinopolyspora halophila TaxID=1981511 RepID=A0A329QKK0_9ACTN|nr:ABC transporter permease [Phytoactinopolyspora halophila]AYY14343.1 molybdate ABC transporter permease subunit [Actinobacteria bacterium YIM 96077]RAW11932.1 molybdate ABC transporter permease subunit [Phytoactinopolyspora halophila]